MTGTLHPTKLRHGAKEIFTYPVDRSHLLVFGNKGKECQSWRLAFLPGPTFSPALHHVFTQVGEDRLSMGGETGAIRPGRAL